MRKIWGIDGTVYSVSGKILDVFLLSLLWLAGCLPVVSVFASCAAAQEAAQRCIRQEEGKLAQTFIEMWKQKLRESIPATILYGVVGIILALFTKTTLEMPWGQTQTLFMTACVLSLNFFFLVNSIWFPTTLLHGPSPFWKRLRLNFFFSVREFLRAFVLLLCVGIAIFFVRAFWLLLMFVPGVFFWIAAGQAERALQKYPKH